MGTRLLSEHIIKKHSPHLKYVRIHSGGGHTAVIYAWNENLQLSDQDAFRLRRLAAGHLSPYVSYKVKPYDKLQEDGIPVRPELPESVVEAAMSRSVQQTELLARINRLFPIGQIAFNRYDAIHGTIHFDVYLNPGITAIEKELFQEYLHEVIPLGSSFELTYH
ncbi:hypothetical protein J2T17_003664 [Paenibacillus mucilaginosus]